MSGAQPIGIPLYYTRNNDSFKWDLATGKTFWSMESLHYLNFLSETKFQGQIIQSVVTGEKIVETRSGNFSVDGYINFEGEDYFIEFMGCRYHSCLLNCGTKSVNDTREADRKKFDALRDKGTVLRVFGCEWEKTKKSVGPLTYSPYSSLFYLSQISQDDILLAIANNQFFGFANCDIFCPPEVKKYWSFYPPIFVKLKPDFESLSSEMQQFFPVKKPTEQLSVAFNATGLLLGTESIRFYLEQGFRITKINYALEYQKG